jgi:hypothetical protein
MRKTYRILLYVFVCLMVLLLPNMISFVKMEWQWLGQNVAKENLWTSISLACIALLVEFFYSHRHEYKRQSPKIYATSASPLYFDSPTSSDLLNRKSYAKLLLDKIYSSFSNQERNYHSFVIHIGEHYGQGKTSFLMMLEEEIKSRKVPVVNIHFEPWLCDSEAGIINEFFDTFRIEVGKYLPRLNGTMQQYVKLLLSSIKYESRWLTVSLASLFGCKSTLKTTHDLLRDELMKIDCPIIITIDDVDRLQGKELMMVLKIIRDTADFPNVFYIVAADNIHLKRMLKSLNINNPDEYLKKFFNLEFQLPANENVAFGKLLKMLEGKYQDLGIDEKTSVWYIWQIRKVAFVREAFPNMRDVYRFINSYFLSIDSMQEVRQLNLFDLFLLTLIQTLNMEYYLQLRDHSLNLLNVVHSGNDILLQWKGDLNVIQKRQEKEAMAQVERIRAKDINTPYKEKRSEEVVIPDFEETIKKTIITPNDILPGLMNLLFGQGTQNVAPNRACRHNMFFKYFANIDASYMVSRMEVIDMLNSDENVYRSRLIEMFETQRDAHFLSEFTYSIPYVKRYKETDVLKRFFIFIALSYKYKRDLTDHSMIKSLADYEGWEPSRHKLFNVLACMYGRNKQVNVKDKLDNFTLLCTTCSNINILLVCLNIMSNQLGYFIFDRKYVDETNILLVDRFFKEKVEKSKGNIGIQEIDTIIQIQCDYDMREHWNKRFEQLIKEDKNTCLNLFCRLVIFYNNGNIEWDFHYKRAILGESSLPEDNLLSRLAEAFPDEKDIFHSLLTLHNHCRSLTDVSNLKDDAFIKMASSRQNR